MKRPDLFPTTFDGALSKFIEEASEALRCIAKIQMHGRTATDPKTKIEYDNVRDLWLEIRDVQNAIDLIEKTYYAEHPDHRHRRFL